MTTKPAFPALGAPMSPAWVHGSPHVEDSALPKPLKSCNFTLAKAVIRWMSVEAVEIDQQEMHRPFFMAGRVDGLIQITREANAVRERGERVSLESPARGCGPAHAFRGHAQAP